MNILINKVFDDSLQTDEVLQAEDILQEEEQIVEQFSRQASKEVGTDMESSPIYTEEIGQQKKLFDINTESILKGILFSEILGKPKSKRLGR